MIIINEELCSGCELCIDDCNSGKLELVNDKVHVIQNNACLSCGHCVAVCPAEAVSFSEFDTNEIVAYDKATFDVSAENLLNTIKMRRSIRSFTNEPVEKEKIQNILQAAAYSPSGGNRRLIRYVVLEKGDVLQKTIKMALTALDNLAQTNPDLIANTMNPNYITKWREMYKEYSDMGRDRLFYNAPAVIIMAAQDRDRIDAGIAASNMELMCHAQGLGACFIGLFCIAASLDNSIKELLGIESKETILTALAIGYSNRKYLRTVNRMGFQKVSWLK